MKAADLKGNVLVNLADLKVTSPEMLLKIGGVIDIQGFHVKNKFVPRQLAVITRDTIASVIDFNTGINYNDLSTSDRHSVNNTQKNLHHLDFEPSVYINYLPFAKDYDSILKCVAIELGISRDNPFGVDNLQTEILLTVSEIPFIPLRNLIPALPSSNRVIEHYTKIPSTFTAASKVSALWRLIISKQFEIKNSAGFEYNNVRVEPAIESLITESVKTHKEELSKINDTLNQVLGDLMHIRIDIDQVCTPKKYGPSS